MDYRQRREQTHRQRDCAPPRHGQVVERRQKWERNLPSVVQETVQVGHTLVYCLDLI